MEVQQKYFVFEVYSGTENVDDQINRIFCGKDMQQVFDWIYQKLSIQDFEDLTVTQSIDDGTILATWIEPLESQPPENQDEPFCENYTERYKLLGVYTYQTEIARDLKFQFEKTDVTHIPKDWDVSTILDNATGRDIPVFGEF